MIIPPGTAETITELKEGAAIDWINVLAKVPVSPKTAAIVHQPRRTIRSRNGPDATARTPDVSQSPRTCKGESSEPSILFHWYIASRRMNKAIARDPATFRLDLAIVEYAFATGACTSCDKTPVQVCNSACLSDSLSSAAAVKTLLNASEIFDESNFKL